MNIEIFIQNKLCMLASATAVAFKKNHHSAWHIQSSLNTSKSIKSDFKP